MDPETFLYYLPSLLICALRDAGYLQEAIDAILPDNKWHKPRGKWWATFRGCVSEQQRIALCKFLAHIRAQGRIIKSGLEPVLIDAERIWES